MPDGVTVKVLNRERLISRFRRLIPASRQEVTAAAIKGAEEVASLARRFSQNARVRATIHVEPIPDKLAAFVVMGDASTLVEARKGSGQMVNLAKFEEFGTKPHTVGGKFKGAHHPGTKPRPALFPASNLLKKTNKRRMGTALGKAARKVSA